MGGTVSSGKNNNAFTDNLIDGAHIRTPMVERVFRIVDRGHYMPPTARHQAYRDCAWKQDHLHLSAPCIYSAAMEALELREGQSFLNVGSGTGYMNTMVGLIVGPSGVNHGVEVHADVVEYANEHVKKFIWQNPGIDEMEFCEPKFIQGNILNVPKVEGVYDRIYCGADVPLGYNNFFQQMLRVGGILVMPYRSNLVQIKRIAPGIYQEKRLLQVSFVRLITPAAAEGDTDDVSLPDVSPGSLQSLCRAVVRGSLRRQLLQSRPELAPAAPRPPPTQCPRRRRWINRSFNGDEAELLLDELRGFGGIIEPGEQRDMNALVRIVLSMDDYHNVLRSPNDHSDSESEEPLDLRQNSLENVRLNLRDVRRRAPASSTSSSSLSLEDTCWVETDSSIGDIDSVSDSSSGDDHGANGNNQNASRNRTEVPMDDVVVITTNDSVADNVATDKAVTGDAIRDNSCHSADKLNTGNASIRTAAHDIIDNINVTKDVADDSDDSFYKRSDGSSTSCDLDKNVQKHLRSETNKNIGDVKKVETKKVETKKVDTKKEETKKVDTKEEETKTVDTKKVETRKPRSLVRLAESRIFGVNLDTSDDSDDEKPSTSEPARDSSGSSAIAADSGVGSFSPSLPWDPFSSDEAMNGAAGRGRKRRHATRNSPRKRKEKETTPISYDGNRQTLSNLLQQLVSQLPLPLSLRLYINYHRPFDIESTTHAPKQSTDTEEHKPEPMSE